MPDLIERLRRWNLAQDATRTAVNLQRDITDAADEIERLRELTENDSKEIGSYRERTGLRGEIQDAWDRIEKLQAVVDAANDWRVLGEHPELDAAIAALEDEDV